MANNIEAERRKFPRLNASVRIDYSVIGKETTEASQTKNISAGGICLIVFEDIETGTILELKIYLPDNVQPMLVKGRVVWKSDFFIIPEQKKRFEVGIEFLEIKESDQQRIFQYVFSLITNKG